MLALTLVATSGYLLLRPRQSGEDTVTQPAADVGTTAPAVTPPSVPRLPVSVPAVPAPPPAPPVASPIPQPADPPPPTKVDESQLLDATPSTLLRNHSERLAEADERVFNELALPEATRAYIRQIDADHARQQQAAVQQPAAAARAARAAADQARRSALINLLGPEGQQTFDHAERIAVLRLRGKYRREWGSALQKRP